MLPAQLAVGLAALAFLLAALVGLFRRRRARRLWLLPVHLVLTGTADLVVYSVGLGMQRGPHNSSMVYTVTPLAYTALLAYWTWAAWRDERPPRGAAPETVQRLQPWR